MIQLGAINVTFKHCNVNLTRGINDNLLVVYI